jgi:DNA-binding NarL/FixJ family response regulator
VRLTPREREILQALTAGMSDKDLAIRFGVSTKTISSHVANILAKLGVDSRLQAVLLALRHGITTLD